MGSAQFAPKIPQMMRKTIPATRAPVQTRGPPGPAPEKPPAPAPPAMKIKACENGYSRITRARRLKLRKAQSREPEYRKDIPNEPQEF